MLLITSRKCVGQPYSRTPYSVLHTDRPSSAEYDILSAEEETPERNHPWEPPHTICFVDWQRTKGNVHRTTTESSFREVLSFVLYQKYAGSKICRRCKNLFGVARPQKYFCIVCRFLNQKSSRILGYQYPPPLQYTFRFLRISQRHEGALWWSQH